MDKISVILVEPQSPGNIGMTCRAMANFGISDLRLVNPCDHLHKEARKFAVGGAHLLGKARVFTDLQSAIGDLQLSVAATRRQGVRRGNPLHVAQTPQLLPQISENGRLGLVFGREDCGLTSKEVGLCSYAASIPSSDECGSLNLAQAVMVFLYEFSRHPPEWPTDSAEGLPSQKEMEGLFQQMESILTRIAFLNPACPERIMNTLRQIHHRAALSRRDFAILRGMWSQLGWSIRDWRGRKRSED